MKLLLPFIILLALATPDNNVLAQEQCGTGSRMIPSNPDGVARLQSIKDKIANAPFAKQSGDTLVFPTVVHIFHNGIAGNISDSQVVDGLRIVNEDFNRENSDTSATRDLFKPHAAAVGFKFVLAKLDSNGDSTSAIVRIDTVLYPHPEPTDSDFDNVKFISQWPADKYYNIWIVLAIQGGALGYAQYPGTNFTYGGPWNTWGIVVKHNQWGTIGTSSADGRTGTHEVGHTFGLYHTFLSSSASCGTVCDTTGDEVCDTPPCNYTGACSQLANSCANDTVGPSAFGIDSVDQIENYMSYNTCQNMFSQGQRDRMRGFVAEFPTLTGLSSDSNLLATGIIDVIPIGMRHQGELAGAVTLFPNPFDDRFKVIVGNEQKITAGDIRIVNVLGQEVEHSLQLNSFYGSNQHLTIRMNSNLDPGIYFLILNLGDKTSVQKIIKE